MLPLNFELEDGRTVEIVQLNKKISTKAILNFINQIIEENLYITYDKKVTLAQEEKWKKEKLEIIKNNEAIILFAVCNKKVVASLEARRERGKMRENVCCGIVIAKDFRGAGLGEYILQLLIKEAKRKLKLKNIYLIVFAENKPAIALYKKLGFTKLLARYPKWLKHKGKYIDQLVLLLVDK